MTEKLELQEEDVRRIARLKRPCEGLDFFRSCDGCDRPKPDVGLYAENSESGEALWLCLACGDW